MIKFYLILLMIIFCSCDNAVKEIYLQLKARKALEKHCLEYDVEEADNRLTWNGKDPYSYIYIVGCRCKEDSLWNRETIRCYRTTCDSDNICYSEHIKELIKKAKIGGKE